MAGSRGFLLVLLIATVTCIVVIQVSLDGWIRRGSLNFYQFVATNQKEIKADLNSGSSRVPIKKTNSSELSLPQSTQLNISSTLRSAIPLTSANVSTTIKNSPTVASQRVQAKVRVRNLHVAKPVVLHVPKQPLLLNQQSKLQELLKRKDILQRRAKGDPMKGVKTMPTVDPLLVNRIFLITYFRSGSSFLGELLQQNWKTFYQFEPLHYMTYGSRISGSNRTEEAFELFNSIYHCNFSNLDNYFQWIRKPKNQFLFTRSLFLWFTCRTNPRMCFNPDFVSAVCKRAPVQVIKTTRLHMSQLKIFLDQNPDLNIKVVYLTRDPRGIISSRTSLDWCNGTDCSNPTVICSEMANDIRVFEELSSKDSSRFIRIRYEDLALNPEKEAYRLFEFLNLSFSQSVRRFLKSHTTARKSDDLDPYSTRRNSSSMAFSWKKRFNFEQVRTVQNTCSNVIDKLNYSLITSPNELDYPKGENFRNLSENSKMSKKVNSFQIVATHTSANVYIKQPETSPVLLASNVSFLAKKGTSISSSQSSSLHIKSTELKNLMFYKNSLKPNNSKHNYHEHKIER